MLATTYTDSKGAKKIIAEMPFKYLKSAHDKLVRERVDATGDPEIAAMSAQLDKLNAEFDAANPVADEPVNERIHAGANNPPSDPFSAIKTHIEDLFAEAKNWADGQPLETQAQADDVSALLRMVQEAATQADKQRIAENEPFDAGKRAVQEKFAPLIADTKAERGKTVLAIEALKKVLAPWLQKVRDEQEAEAQRARETATALANEAAAAMRATDGLDLQAREDAEAMVADARRAETVAKQAETARPQASGYGRATTLRDNWQPILTDSRAAAAHFWAKDREAFDAFLLILARGEVNRGVRALPGFDIVNQAVVA